MGYKIIRDTREQKGWTFSKNKMWDGMEETKLDTGDYAIKGHEKELCIERKSSVSEIAINLIRNFKTFEKELIRMKEYKRRYIICEFSLSELLEYPKGSYMEKKSNQKRRVSNGPYILKRLLKVQLEYDLQVLFCDSPTNAYTTACQIIKEVIFEL